MAHSIQTKQKVITLRREGLSLNEIAKIMQLSKSTVSEWTAKVPLSPAAQQELKRKHILGQYKAIIIKKERRQKQKEKIYENAQTIVKTLPQSPNLLKLYCALLWWCEGNKDTGQIRFTNSDPTLIKNFLYTLRNGFQIQESKLRVLVHIHEYHNDNAQKIFWSNVTGIPITQFHRSYLKAHTGIRKHTNYQGCIAISYYDAEIAKELEAIYNAFTNLGAFVNG